MVRGEFLSGNMKRHLLSVIILTISLGGQAAAVLAVEPQQIEAPPMGQSEVAPNTEQPPAVNPVEEINLVIKLRERRVYVYRGDRIESS